MKKFSHILLVIVMLVMILSSTSVLMACDPAAWIEFETNGGTSVETIGGIASVTIETEPITIREGYDFLGWYESSDFSGQRVSFPYTFTSSMLDRIHFIILYARWEAHG